MFQVFLKSNEDLSEHILILPAISVGNVGQLAVDLLISSLRTTKVGHIHTAYIHALVGREAFSNGTDPNKGKLTLACEIYRCEDHPVIIIQINAPIVKGKAALFRAELRKWIKEQKFSKTVLLSSSYAHQRTDAQINDPTCRFLCTPQLETLQDQLSRTLNWRVLEVNTDIPFLHGLHMDGRHYLPGGGITSYFLKECADDNIPLVVLLKFCFEGNNIPDAIELASYLNQWLHLFQQDTWKFPESWQLMFGNSAPLTIY